MHFANLESSDRLQRVLEVLKRGGKFSTMDLIRGSGYCAINSIISEIRANGISVDCKREGNAWFYWIPQ